MTQDTQAAFIATDHYGLCRKGFQWRIGETRNTVRRGKDYPYETIKAYASPQLACVLSTAPVGMYPFPYHVFGVVGHVLSRSVGGAVLEMDLATAVERVEVPARLSDEALSRIVVACRYPLADPEVQEWLQDWLAGRGRDDWERADYINFRVAGIHDDWPRQLARKSITEGHAADELAYYHFGRPQKIIEWSIGPESIDKLWSTEDVAALRCEWLGPEELQR